MWILDEIETRGGEVDFHDFMELALYHSKYGYYASKHTPLGRRGDFITAPTVSLWYGATCAGFLAELSARFGGSLGLIDLAGGDGSFVASVLHELGDDAPGTLNKTIIVDRSAAMLNRARRHLADAGVPVEFAAETPGMGEIPVVVHASELYDAMPVHRVEWTAGGLVEHMVRVTGRELCWRTRAAGPELEQYFINHGVQLTEGQLAEANLAAEKHHHRVLESAREGIVLVLDYGYEAARLYDSRGRRQGSLVSHRQHRVGRDVLDSPGEQDLTAHVNWDDLRRAAAGAGWQEIALMPMAEFLVRAGLEARVRTAGFGIEAELNAETVTVRQEVKQLLDPEGMGSDLKMLIQGKGELGRIAAEILNRDL